MAAKAERVKTGEVFGRLTVTDDPIERIGKNLHVPVICVCGKKLKVQQPCLRSGNTTSCGCLRAEQIGERSFKHGKCNDKVYSQWADMVQRCTNPNASNYAYYGGRGITVLSDWLDFDTFYKSVGEPPTNKHSLERLDTNKGYCPDNVVWATWKEQCANRRNSVRYTLNGELKTIAELADLASCTVGAMQHRLTRYSPENAIKLQSFDRSKDRVIKPLEAAVKLKLYGETK